MNDMSLKQKKNLRFLESALLFLFFISVVTSACAQPTLTLDQAIDQALKQNFGLQSAQINIKEAENNVTRGNAGFLPTLTLNGALTPGAVYLNQQNKLGGSISEINRTAFSNNIGVGTTLGYTLLDGRRRYYTYDRLKALKLVSDLNFSIQVEQLISDVSKAYFNVIRQERISKTYNEEIGLFEERARLAKTRLDVGSGNNLDVLQAEVDLNTQRSLLIRQQGTVITAKAALAQLMTQPNYNFEVADTSAPVRTDWNIDALNKAVLEKNQSLELFQRQSEVLQLVVRETETLASLRLGVNATLSANRVDNQAGINLLNQNIGLTPGIVASLPLYDGHNIKRLVENAKLEVVANRLRMQQSESDLGGTLATAYQNFQYSLQVLTIEEQSEQLARQSIDIAQERFRLGRSTILDLKLIQKDFEDVKLREIAARFDAKNAEIDLMRLTGMFIR